MNGFFVGVMVWWFDFGSMTSGSSYDSLCYQRNRSRDTNIVGGGYCRKFGLGKTKRPKCGAVGTEGMATEDTPARKMRRIIEDEDDSDEDLPDISDPAFLKPRKALTPPLAKSGDNSEDDELFGDEDEDDEDEAAASSRRKR